MEAGCIMQGYEYIYIYMYVYIRNVAPKVLLSAFFVGCSTGEVSG